MIMTLCLGNAGHLSRIGYCRQLFVGIRLFDEIRNAQGSLVTAVSRSFKKLAVEFDCVYIL